MQVNSSVVVGRQWCVHVNEFLWAWKLSYGSLQYVESDGLVTYIIVNPRQNNGPIYGKEGIVLDGCVFTYTSIHISLVTDSF